MNPSLRSCSSPIPTSCGVGLRFQHHEEVLRERPAVAWFEVHAENYMGGGAPLKFLEAIRAEYPISLHGVGLSLGSAEGLDERHLARLRSLADRIEPGLVSEHLSWSAIGGVHFPDLLPLPYTDEALAVVCRNVAQAQEGLRRQILVENPSSYLRYAHSTIPEWEFVSAVSTRTGCALLLDINNIVVSASNHGWDARKYLAALPAARVAEVHLAGHTVRTFADGRSIRIDDHGSRVSEEVWALYAEAIARAGPVPTLVEWDNDVPPIAVLLEEARRADVTLQKELASACAA